MRISTRSYENLSVSKLVKTAINTAITGKLLKSNVTIRLKCGSGCGTQRTYGADAERIWDKMGNGYGDKMGNGYGDKMGNGYGDKMRRFNEFFASFLRSFFL